MIVEAMRFHHAHGPLLRRWAGQVVASAAVFVLLVSLPLHAADVPIMQGTGITLGARPRQLIVPPAEPGYTLVSAKSSNPQVVQINGVTLAGGTWGVNFTVTGSGVGVVIVMWNNPTARKVQRQYFVVASGVRVNGASRIVMSTGDTMPVPAPNALAVNAYPLDNLQAPPVVSAQLRSNVEVLITGRDKGRSAVQIRLPPDPNGTIHYQIIIVSVVGRGEPPID